MLLQHLLEVFACMTNHLASRMMDSKIPTLCRVVSRCNGRSFDPYPEADDRDAWPSCGREPDRPDVRCGVCPLRPALAVLEKQHCQRGGSGLGREGPSTPGLSRHGDHSSVQGGGNATA